MKSSKGWLSYSNVVATVALFVALGGGAWALSKNSVGSRELEKGAVRSSELENGTIKGKDVKSETLGGTQIEDGSLSAAELGDGAVGSGEIADGAVGSSKVPNNAVGASEIAGGAVGSSEIAANAVGSGKVANGSLTGGDVATDSLTGAQIDESTLGIAPDAAQLAGRELVSVVGSTTVVDEVLLTLPALGAELRTDGSPVDDFNIVFENTGNPGKLIWACPAGSAGGLSVGGTATGTPAPGEGTMVCYAWDRADPTGPGRTTILCAHDGGASLIICDVLRTP